MIQARAATAEDSVLGKKIFNEGNEQPPMLKTLVIMSCSAGI